MIGHKGVENENDIGMSCSSLCCCLYSLTNTAAFDSREVTMNSFKMFLFTTIMLLQSILSTIVPTHSSLAFMDPFARSPTCCL